MRNIMRMGVLSVALLNPGMPAHAPEVGLPNLVVEVAVDSLKDVAMAMYTPWRGIIYYSPALHDQLGPRLSTFFRAHEFGHLYHHHVRSGSTSSAELRDYELEADCYAAQRLGNSARGTIEAAIAFFESQATQSVDDEHPTGAVRAATIMKCVGES